MTIPEVHPEPGRRAVQLAEGAGLRPGERLYEKLFTESEKPRCTEHEKIFVSRNGVSPSREQFAQQVE